MWGRLEVKLLWSVRNTDNVSLPPPRPRPTTQVDLFILRHYPMQSILYSAFYDQHALKQSADGFIYHWLKIPLGVPTDPKRVAGFILHSFLCSTELFQKWNVTIFAQHTGRPISRKWYRISVSKISTQGRIIHCAGCTMGGAPPPGVPPPISCQICTTLFWRLKVQCTLKRNDDQKRSSTFLGKKCTATDKTRSSAIAERPRCRVG